MTNLAFPHDQKGNGDAAEDVLFLDRRHEGRAQAFLGVNFSGFSPQSLLRRIDEIGSAKRPFVYLCTPNVDHMVRLDKEPVLCDFYENAWANVNDSRILETLADLSGLSLPACPGSDLTQALFETSIDPAEPVVVIGGIEEVIETVRARYGLTDLRWHAPPFGLRTNPEAMAEAAAFVAANPARFTFLCVGSPQQEMLARVIQQQGQAVGIGLCVGASIDFLSGNRKRAPQWMQQARLEWLFRLLDEPQKLWRRYLVEGPKIFRIWLAWRKRR
ncbi:MAG: WecB/TagA/CpsF family glycosyltransferase [Hyphomonadaceae bacterium]|jgi:N-acetylglucosaminyldiphosphoundecaprenol N-acetyl-beta-D-mannosaminyltransferase|uniref:WecB/TagA/CpsF family glycosyltransferase n=1 Tax=Aquidulcibacter sp. TaxID=2052990 RepID=UPI0022C95BA8|nr:WecB/TagA/CpsF family glycosyltransferase [Aquidulcibacter sp.]MCE2892382.1 WecB/TagA/CpsF family glycosyltransferase [Hyphomonadaceae bacterium]MCZ8209526.1 WecB/TagA/CpsF family glycosyltransferase [Aquidulcibacter sp.]